MFFTYESHKSSNLLAKRLSVVHGWFFFKFQSLLDYSFTRFHSVVFFYNNYRLAIRHFMNSRDCVIIEIVLIE